MTTDTSEKGLEALIVADMMAERAGSGESEGLRPRVRVDLAQLATFLEATQPNVGEALDLDQDGPTRRKFLARLQGEITKRGVIDVLRNGRQARAASPRPLLRHAVAGQRQGRRSATPPTASASRASSATAATRRSARSIWACSSTACRSPPSS